MRSWRYFRQLVASICRLRPHLPGEPFAVAVAPGSRPHIASGCILRLRMVVPFRELIEISARGRVPTAGIVTCRRPRVISRRINSSRPVSRNARMPSPSFSSGAVNPRSFRSLRDGLLWAGILCSRFHAAASEAARFRLLVVVDPQLVSLQEARTLIGFSYFRTPRPRRPVAGPCALECASPTCLSSAVTELLAKSPASDLFALPRRRHVDLRHPSRVRKILADGQTQTTWIQSRVAENHRCQSCRDESPRPVVGPGGRRPRRRSSLAR